MCYSRDSFCKCCKQFIKVLTVNHCLKSVCKKVVYSKFTVKCNTCQTCIGICNPLFKLHKCWYQKSNVYVQGFAVQDGNLVLFLYQESKLSISRHQLTVISKYPHFLVFNQRVPYGCNCLELYKDYLITILLARQGTEVFCTIDFLDQLRNVYPYSAKI